MFKLNETYTTKAGHEARVICVDAGIKYSMYTCDIVAIISGIKASTGSKTVTGVYSYDKDGRYYGSGNAQFDLVSNEPTEEETRLMQSIRDIIEGNAKDPDAAMLTTIRQLRKPKQ